MHTAITRKEILKLPAANVHYNLNHFMNKIFVILSSSRLALNFKSNLIIDKLSHPSDKVNHHLS